MISWRGTSASGPGFEGQLDQGDVHPPVELVGGVPNRADDLKAQLRMELETGAVVRGDRRDDRSIAKTAGLLDELREQSLTDATPLVDRIDVHEILHNVEAAL